ncbi:MAG TPA: topoisomerase IV [Candidatus Faeciplasma gallinarum]|uniref:DNA topoisomerase (ATP-hydrolyzing) n=1 Tax=Candidatus Faeciplasma gallinarum TaxID=2840799 RepID=A0A9D1ENM0_9FIRM|nr:topoisomerase IV [Candidatus Faeciplasma gallinarum]
MPKKKSGEEKPRKQAAKLQPNAYINGAGTVIEEPITVTLEKNYMPYAMSVIVSRAFPEIDGFKPSHRKLLYTMYDMGLLSGPRTKSANIVGQTMKLNPHGDQAIYETMVRLTRGNEALLHPYIDSKGNFGKAYSSDMAYAASRYTEAKLDAICNELFCDIDKDTVNFVPNYDNKMMEPELLPVTFPTILVNSNVGIGVSMASAICPFNLKELCEATIAIIRDPDFDAMQVMNGPDFPGGGYMIYDAEKLRQIFDTGRGSVKIRAKYRYDKDENCIEITEIPPTTTIEAIIEKVVELAKNGLKEVSYIRDETDLSGLKITIDLKRGVDPDELMKKLYQLTPLQDSFSANFNILVNGYPKVLGVNDIIKEWISFRVGCVKRRVSFEMKKKEERLHLLKGLEKILLDIDKAIKIVRETDEEADVVPNLMIGFGIDQTQAEYVAEIKLRHLNREFILKRIDDIAQLEKDIADMRDILGSERKIKLIIIDELKRVSEKYGQPRKTEIIYVSDEPQSKVVKDVPDYQCRFVLTREGYFKKITAQSLRMASKQKLKENDVVSTEIDSTNRADILFFTDKANVYKTKASQFPDTKAAQLGEFIPVELKFEEGENVAAMAATLDYSGFLLFVYKNGKVAKVPLSSYETKTNRKMLSKAYSDKCGLVQMLDVGEGAQVMLRSTNGRAIIFDTGMILPKASRDTVGVQAMTLKAKSEVESAYILTPEKANELSKYRVNTLPAAGPFAKGMDDPDQITF